MQKIFRIIFVIAVCYHAFFYISALKTHTLDAWYEHTTPGQDFFQIPNAVYAFLHGGTLQGKLPDNVLPYTTCCAINDNVYHPLFTFLIGFPLQLLAPWTAFAVWIIVHIIITLFTLYYLWHNHRKNPVLYLALGTYLLISYHYYEIKMAQYHFLFVFFVMLFLHDSEKNGDTIRTGIWLFLSLLVKPIGLLFLIPLLLYKRWRTVLIGFGFFFLATISTVIMPENRYYALNIIDVSKKAITTNYNLYAISHFLPVSPQYIQWGSYLIACILILYQVRKKPPLFVILTSWICFQLLFYSSVFAYYYTIAAPILALSFLFGYLRITAVTITITLLFILPTPAIYFHLRGSPEILPLQEYLFLAIWSCFTLIWLSVEILFSHLRNQEA